MLAIAILSLIGLVIGILIELVEQRDKPSTYAVMAAISVIAWWEISFPLAIVILTISVIWFAIVCYVRS